MTKTKLGVTVTTVLPAGWEDVYGPLKDIGCQYCDETSPSTAKFCMHCGENVGVKLHVVLQETVLKMVLPANVGVDTETGKKLVTDAIASYLCVSDTVSSDFTTEQVVTVYLDDKDFKNGKV